MWGTSGTGTGVEGRTTGSTSNSYGVFGNATGNGTGGYFYSASGTSLIASGRASIGGKPGYSNSSQPQLLKNVLEVHGTNNKIGLNDDYRCLTLFSKDTTLYWDMYINDFPGQLRLRATGFGSTVDVGYFDRASGQYFPISNRNLKTEILPLRNILNKVLKLKPSTYEFISNKNNHRNEIGLIAQEVEEFFQSLLEKIKMERA